MPTTVKIFLVTLLGESTPGPNEEVVEPRAVLAQTLGASGG